MYKRLNELSFVIGLFFTLVSLILLAGSLFSSGPASSLTVSSAIVFLVFGVVMILIRGNQSEE